MDALVLLTPLAVLMVIVWFGFVGCGSFGTTPAAPGTPSPTPETPPPPATPPATPPPPPTPYKDVLAKQTPGFVAHWPLDEKSDDKAFVNGPLAPTAHGRYSLPGVTLGQPGALSEKGNVAALFDGTKGYVEVAYHGSLNPSAGLSFSIELWMKPMAGAPVENRVLVSSRQARSANQRRGYDILVVRNVPQPVIRARVFAPNINETEVDVPLTEENAWHYVVCTYRGGANAKLSLWVGVSGVSNPTETTNNTNVAYEPIEAPPQPPPAPQPADTTLRFGAGHKPNGEAQSFFAGWLDEIAFYNEELKKEHVEAHFTKATTPQ
jgi:hypothetical protein